MTALFDRRLRRCWRLARAASLLAVLACAGRPAWADDVISVVLDQAKIARLPDRASTIVIGNPLIADVTLQAGGMMIITGKGYGVTNLIALDRSGAVLAEQAIQVQGPQDNVVIVYRGINRESYSCAPKCERRITLGDTPDFFDATLAQTGNRNSRAQGQGGGAQPAR